MPSTGENTFDPFADRLARDIRNSLSTAMVAALQHGNRSDFADRCRRWLRRDLPLPHRRYIEQRSLAFEALFEQLRTARSDDPLLLAVRLWNAGLFFEVHEVVEKCWQNASGKRRTALKGLVQAAGSYVHREAGHMRAAQRLAEKAAAHLDAAHGALGEIANITELVSCLQRGSAEAPHLAYDKAP